MSLFLRMNKEVMYRQKLEQPCAQRNLESHPSERDTNEADEKKEAKTRDYEILETWKK